MARVELAHLAVKAIARADGEDLLDRALADQECLPSSRATTTDRRRREKSKGISSTFE